MGVQPPSNSHPYAHRLASLRCEVVSVAVRARREGDSSGPLLSLAEKLFRASAGPQRLLVKTYTHELRHATKNCLANKGCDLKVRATLVRSSYL